LLLEIQLSYICIAVGDPVILYMYCCWGSSYLIYVLLLDIQLSYICIAVEDPVINRGELGSH
jgi:hypothetical protein